MAEHLACVRQKRGTYIILVRKHEGKRKFGRRRCKWFDNHKICLQGNGLRMETVLICLRVSTSGMLNRFNYLITNLFSFIIVSLISCPYYSHTSSFIADNVIHINLSLNFIHFNVFGCVRAHRQMCLKISTNP
jgi:hypothetical protein